MYRHTHKGGLARFRAGIDDTLALSRVLVPVHQSPYPVPSVCNFMRHTVLGALRLSQTVTYVQAVPHCAIFFTTSGLDAPM